ncbi:MAG: hypothetical protein RIN55_12780 [Tissierellaceae bacterium]|nr:hypothetical protein [Tissierellaceae bacterium]
MGFNRDTVIETVLIFTLLGGIALGVYISYEYFIITPLALIALIVFNKIKKNRLIRLGKEKLKLEWGSDHIEKRVIEDIKKLFDFLSKKRGNSFVIDDITWRDLNMDSVFAKIDHTKSLPGMNYLYNMLRNPLFDKKELQERNNIINSFKENKNLSIEIQWPLSILGKKEGKDIFFYFENGLNVKTNKLIIYRILSILSYLSVGLLVINREIGFTIFMLVWGINAGIYQKNKNKVHEEIEVFIYLGNLVKCLDSIVKVKVNKAGIYIDNNKLKSLLKPTNKIYKNISKLNTSAYGTSDIQILMDYINMVTLRETIIFYNTINLINEYREEFIEIYKAIGEIDAYISIASYKDSLGYYTEPRLIEDSSKIYLYTEKMYHPLLDDPVPYTFELNNRGVLVTGSNASGKSTYLRSIGVNALFSQTMYLVLAKEYEANYFKLLTSIGTTDSIEEGDSYFMTEAKSLKRVIDSLSPNQPVLCILDEIFRGTNTAERISAAKEVLNYMINRNTLVVAATHDLELTTMVNDRYDNYHFQEDIKENDIEFDYVLRKGPCTSRNAIAILRYLGYPKEIYDNANRNVDCTNLNNPSKISGKF